MSQQVIAAAPLKAGTWSIDASHSTVAFTARHLMSKVRGTFA
jgi:polyisoprenoid-binding protein YceI